MSVLLNLFQTFLKICQDLLEKQGSAAKKDLPRLQDLISLLSKLVKKIQAGFPKPHILKVLQSCSDAFGFQQNVTQ